MVTYDFEQPADCAARTSLLDLCFGPERYGRAAEALREGQTPIEGLSLVGRADGQLVATIQFWSISLVDMLNGGSQPAVLLGPLAVHPDFQGKKVSRTLMQTALKRADQMGIKRIFLVGDTAFYEPYGFRNTAPCHITLPGGRDADRLMVRQTGAVKALPGVGQLIAADASADRQKIAVASASPYGEPVYMSA